MAISLQCGVFGYNEESTNSEQSSLDQAMLAAYKALIMKLSDSLFQ
jgi:hypothetical protein